MVYNVGSRSVDVLINDLILYYILEAWRGALAAISHGT